MLAAFVQYLQMIQDQRLAQLYLDAGLDGAGCGHSGKYNPFRLRADRH